LGIADTSRKIFQYSFDRGVGHSVLPGWVEQPNEVVQVDDEAGLHKDRRDPRGPADEEVGLINIPAAVRRGIYKVHEIQYCSRKVDAAGIPVPDGESSDVFRVGRFRDAVDMQGDEQIGPYRPAQVDPLL